MKVYFPKKMRLLTLNEFDFVFQYPKQVKMSGIALFSRRNQLEFSRIGLSISKKYIKYSHERNRIKRYARESFRINQHNIINSDFIVTVYSKKVTDLTNHMLAAILKKLWYHHYLS